MTGLLMVPQIRFSDPKPHPGSLVVIYGYAEPPSLAIPFAINYSFVGHYINISVTKYSLWRM